MEIVIAACLAFCVGNIVAVLVAVSAMRHHREEAAYWRSVALGTTPET